MPSEYFDKKIFRSRVIEPESEFISLQYNRPADCLIAYFRRVTETLSPVHELYYRRSRDPDYTKVDLGSNRIACWDPISCRGKPFVLLNLMRWDEKFMSANWTSVSRLSLIDGNVTPLIDSNTLKIPSGSSRGWVASLLDIDDECKILTCKLALDCIVPPDSSEVEYSVSEVDLTTGQIDKKIVLRGAFF